MQRDFHHGLLRLVSPQARPVPPAGHSAGVWRHILRDMSRLFRVLLFAGAALSAPGWLSSASAQNLASFEARTTVHVLPNGWTFIICERPGAPVFSFATQADVGAAQDPKGQTGMAHMSEHMAFKGTRVIGTTDWAKEGPALEKMDAAYMAWQKAKDARGTDPKEHETLKAA